jgi:hypothetical protein
MAEMHRRLTYPNQIQKKRYYSPIPVAKKYALAAPKMFILTPRRAEGSPSTHRLPVTDANRLSM